MKIIICLVLLAIVSSGCDQSRVSIVFDPNTGKVNYERIGDIEIQEFSATLPNQTKITFGSSKSENLAYRDGIQAAQNVINRLLDELKLGAP